MLCSKGLNPPLILLLMSSFHLTGRAPVWSTKRAQSSSGDTGWPWSWHRNEGAVRNSQPCSHPCCCSCCWVCSVLVLDTWTCSQPWKPHSCRGLCQWAGALSWEVFILDQTRSHFIFTLNIFYSVNPVIKIFILFCVFRRTNSVWIGNLCCATAAKLEIVGEVKEDDNGLCVLISILREYFAFFFFFSPLVCYYHYNEISA